MDNSGKMVNTLVVDDRHLLSIWADPGMERVIARVPGVERACSLHGSPCHYRAYLDPRFDRQVVMASIKLRIEDKARRRRDTWYRRAARKIKRYLWEINHDQ